jgi:predicted TIM-barrel fold metal-dependent hydrolase
MAHAATLVRPSIFKDGMGPASKRRPEPRGDRRLPEGTVVVSADNHWSIADDIFYKKFPSHLKEAAPKLYRTKEGGYLFTIYGKPLLPDLQATIFSEMDNVAGSTRMDARMHDLDIEGIDKELVFGNVVAAFYTYPDLEAREWIYRIYNEYLAEMQALAPGRFYGVGLLNYWDMAKCRSALEEIKSLGLKTFVIPQFPKGANREPMNYCLDEMRPLWEAIDEVGLPMCFHVGEQLQEGPGGCGVSMMLNFAPFRKSMAELIFGGMLDRHPSIQATFVEGDINWIPGALQTADMVYHAYAHEIQPKIEHPPRNYWEKNLHATFMSDRAGLRLIDEIGADRVMWSNDYPHQESVYGAGWTSIQDVLDVVSEDDARKILGGNALELFKLD